MIVNAFLIDEFQIAFIGRAGMLVAVIDHHSHIKVFQHCQQAKEMILMGMGQNDIIQPGNIPVP